MHNFNTYFKEFTYVTNWESQVKTVALIQNICLTFKNTMMIVAEIKPLFIAGKTINSKHKKVVSSSLVRNLDLPPAPVSCHSTPNRRTLSQPSCSRSSKKLQPQLLLTHSMWPLFSHLPSMWTVTCYQLQLQRDLQLEDTTWLLTTVNHMPDSIRPQCGRKMCPGSYPPPPTITIDLMGIYILYVSIDAFS